MILSRRTKLLPLPSTSSTLTPAEKTQPSNNQCVIIFPGGLKVRCKASLAWISLCCFLIVVIILLIYDGDIDEGDFRELGIETEQLKQILRDSPRHVFTSLTQAVQHDVHTIRSILHHEEHDTFDLPKIYVYNLPTEFNVDSLATIQQDSHAWKYYRYQSAEVNIHQRLLQSSLRVMDPTNADLFYVPIYPSTWLSGKSHDLNVREKARSMLLKSIEWLRTEHGGPWWDRYQGADHIFTFTHDQGACLDIRRERDGETILSRRVIHALRNSIHLTTMGDQKSKCFTAARDIVIPPMTDSRFHERHGGIFSKHKPHPQSKSESKSKSRVNVKAQTKTKTKAEATAVAAAVDASENYWQVPFTHFATFRGGLSLEKQNDPWYSITMLYGSYDQQQRLMPQQPPETPTTSGRRACGKTRDMIIKLHTPFSTCSTIIESELSRTRIYSNGVRQRLKSSFWQTKESSRYKPSWLNNPASLAHLGIEPSSKTPVIMTSTPLTYLPHFISEMEQSKFCLAPLGHATWSLRMFEAILVGCVPVIFADDTVFPYEKYYPIESYAILIRESDVSILPYILYNIPDNVVWEKKKILQEIWKAFTWTNTKVNNNNNKKENNIVQKDMMQKDAFWHLAYQLKEKVSNLKKKVVTQDTTKEMSLFPATQGFHGTGLWPDQEGHYYYRLAPTSTTTPTSIPPTTRSKDHLFEMNRQEYQQSSEIRLTVAIHGTWDRIQNLEHLCKYYPHGIISAAILMYVNDYLNPKFEEKNIRIKLIDQVCQQKYGTKVLLTVVYHTRYMEDAFDDITLKFTPSPLQEEKKTLRLYPSNKMRNIALRNVPTTHVISLDIDFVPSKLFGEEFQKTHGAIEWPGDEFTAIVVPAFEWSIEWSKKHSDGDVPIPRTAQEILHLWEEKNIDVFEANQYPSGHSATNSVQWIKNTEMPSSALGEVASSFYKIQYEFGYEPYLILRKPFPVYDERFVGYGQNKVSSIFELALMGYQFYVHPSMFIFHDQRLHHASSPPKILNSFRSQKENDRDKRSKAVHVARTKTKTTSKKGKKVAGAKDWTIGWSCWSHYLSDLRVHYGTATLENIKEPFWVSEYVYPKLHHERGLKCVDQ